MTTEVLKTLGQVVPSPTTLTTLYTVPGATQASVSSIIVCNQGAVQALFRISIAVAGAADDPKQYLYYDIPLPANDTFIATIGVSLGAADVVRCYSSVASVSFQAFGAELS